MLIYLARYKAGVTSYTAYNLGSVTSIEGQLWGTYNEDTNIYIIRQVGGVWQEPILLTTGTNPTIAWDTEWVTVYFENGKKIQSLKFAPYELGQGPTPLQTWDALDPSFAGFQSYPVPGQSFLTGAIVVSPFDDFPAWQPQPTNLNIDRFYISWDYLPSIEYSTITYNVYEDGVLLGTTKYDFYSAVFETGKVYSVTSVYTHWGEDYESNPSSIQINNNILADQIVPEFRGFDKTSLQFTSLDVATLTEDFGSNDAVAFTTFRGFDKTSLQFTNYDPTAIA